MTAPAQLYTLGPATSAAAAVFGVQCHNETVRSSLPVCLTEYGTTLIVVGDAGIQRENEMTSAPVGASEAALRVASTGWFRSSPCLRRSLPWKTSLHVALWDPSAKLSISQLSTEAKQQAAGQCGIDFARITYWLLTSRIRKQFHKQVGSEKSDTYEENNKVSRQSRAFG